MTAEGAEQPVVVRLGAQRLGKKVDVSLPAASEHIGQQFNKKMSNTDVIEIASFGLSDISSEPVCGYELPVSSKECKRLFNI